MSTHFDSFSDFWPFYVCEHSKPETRRLHFIGTSTIVPIIIFAIFVNPYIALLIPVSAYGFAWYSHFFIELNRPATFNYPLWSLMGDFKMFWLMCFRKMDAEVLRCEKVNLDQTLEDVSVNDDTNGM